MQSRSTNSTASTRTASSIANKKVEPLIHHSESNMICPLCLGEISYRPSDLRRPDFTCKKCNSDKATSRYWTERLNRMCTILGYLEERNVRLLLNIEQSLIDLQQQITIALNKVNEEKGRLQAYKSRVNDAMRRILLTRSMNVETHLDVLVHENIKLDSTLVQHRLDYISLKIEVKNLQLSLNFEENDTLLVSQMDVSFGLDSSVMLSEDRNVEKRWECGFCGSLNRNGTQICENCKCPFQIL